MSCIFALQSDAPDGEFTFQKVPMQINSSEDGCGAGLLHVDTTRLKTCTFLAEGIYFDKAGE